MVGRINLDADGAKALAGRRRGGADRLGDVGLRRAEAASEEFVDPVAERGVVIVGRTEADRNGRARGADRNGHPVAGIA